MPSVTSVSLDGGACNFGAESLGVSILLRQPAACNVPYSLSTSFPSADRDTMHVMFSVLSSTSLFPSTHHQASSHLPVLPCLLLPPRGQFLACLSSLSRFQRVALVVLLPCAGDCIHKFVTVLLRSYFPLSFQFFLFFQELFQQLLCSNLENI